MYYKALLSNSVTSVLHLIQPEVWVRTEFLDKMFFEDSAHYLLYSIIYSYSLPVMCKLIYLIKLDYTVILSGVLLPVFLFDVLHLSIYYRGLIEVRSFET